MTVGAPIGAAVNSVYALGTDYAILAQGGALIHVGSYVNGQRVIGIDSRGVHLEGGTILATSASKPSPGPTPTPPASSLDDSDSRSNATSTQTPDQVAPDTQPPAADAAPAPTPAGTDAMHLLQPLQPPGGTK
jgi:hypothetical protein